MTRKSFFLYVIGFAVSGAMAITVGICLLIDMIGELTKEGLVVPFIPITVGAVLLILSHGFKELFISQNEGESE